MLFNFKTIILFTLYALKINVGRCVENVDFLPKRNNVGKLTIPGENIAYSKYNDFFVLEPYGTTKHIGAYNYWLCKLKSYLIECTQV